MLCLAAQSCLTLCDPMSCSLPGSSVHGDSLGKKTEVLLIENSNYRDFPDGSVDKNPPTNAGARVWSQVQEDSTCGGATKPMCQNYWALTLETESLSYWSPRTLKRPALQQEKQLQWEACAPRESSAGSLQLEKAHGQEWRPNTAKSQIKKNKQIR